MECVRVERKSIHSFYAWMIVASLCLLTARTESVPLSKNTYLSAVELLTTFQVRERSSTSRSSDSQMRPELSVSRSTPPERTTRMPGITLGPKFGNRSTTFYGSRPQTDSRASPVWFPSIKESSAKNTCWNCRASLMIALPSGHSTRLRLGQCSSERDQT